MHHGTLSGHLDSILEHGLVEPANMPGRGVCLSLTRSYALTAALGAAVVDRHLRGGDENEVKGLIVKVDMGWLNTVEWHYTRTDLSRSVVVERVPPEALVATTMHTMWLPAVGSWNDRCTLRSNFGARELGDRAERTFALARRRALPAPA